MNLYLIRHGLSLGNCNPQTYYKMEDWKVSLTDKGKQQAEEVSEKLKDLEKPYIYTSPYVRAKETTEIIARPHGGFIYESVLIHERVWGNLREEVDSFETREERNHLFDFFRRPEGGESFSDCYRRAFVFWQYLRNSYGFPEFFNQDIIIVSHGEFLKLLLMIIDGKTVKEFNDLPNIKNCEIIKRTVYV